MRCPWTQICIEEKKKIFCVNVQKPLEFQFRLCCMHNASAYAFQHKCRLSSCEITRFYVYVCRRRLQYIIPYTTTRMLNGIFVGLSGSIRNSNANRAVHSLLLNFFSGQGALADRNNIILMCQSWFFFYPPSPSSPRKDRIRTVRFVHILFFFSFSEELRLKGRLPQVHGINTCYNRHSNVHKIVENGIV